MKTHRLVEHLQAPEQSGALALNNRLEDNMPNWIRNQLTITGSDRDIQAVTKQLGSPFKYPQLTSPRGEIALLEAAPGVMRLVTIADPIFSLWNIVHPEPQDFPRYAAAQADKDDRPFWYLWNRKHWGTKWDVSHARQVQREAGMVVYTFRTPWCPPFTALETLSTQYPMLTLALDWLDFEGTFVEEWTRETLVNGHTVDGVEA